MSDFITQRDFRQLMDEIRKKYSDNKEYNVINGKTLYRNLIRIPNIWGYILEAYYFKIPLNNLFISKINIKPEGNFIRSNWAQHYRYLTHFGFTDNWENGEELKLNNDGLAFKESIIHWLTSNPQLWKHLEIENLDTALGSGDISFLKQIKYLEEFNTDTSVSGNIPQIFIDKYREKIKIISTQGPMTGFVKSILSTLHMALDGKLYGHSNARLPRNPNEEQVFSLYFDLNAKSKNKGKSRDMEWTGWITKNIEQLGLIDLVSEKNQKLYYGLSEDGFRFINYILDFQNIKKPHTYKVTPSSEPNTLVNEDQPDQYNEGGRVLKLHLRIERDLKLIADAKERARNLAAPNGIKCECCGIDTVAHYGIEVIEAHHIVPLYKSMNSKQTKIEDLIMLCPSCHRAVHKVIDKDSHADLAAVEFIKKRFNVN